MAISTLIVYMFLIVPIHPVLIWDELLDCLPTEAYWKSLNCVAAFLVATAPVVCPSVHSVLLICGAASIQSVPGTRSSPSAYCLPGCLLTCIAASIQSDSVTSSSQEVRLVVFWPMLLPPSNLTLWQGPCISMSDWWPSDLCGSVHPIWLSDKLLANGLTGGLLTCVAASIQSDSVTSSLQAVWQVFWLVWQRPSYLTRWQAPRKRSD